MPPVVPWLRRNGCERARIYGNWRARIPGPDKEFCKQTTLESLDEH